MVCFAPPTAVFVPLPDTVVEWFQCYESFVALLGGTGPRTRSCKAVSTFQVNQLLQSS